MAETQPLPLAPTTYPQDVKRKKLRVAIVTENFLPKVDGVTRTLARLLEHLNTEGHEAIVFGPDTGLLSYASHPVVGTFGVPLILYPGLKLNFMRPRFVRRLQQLQPDVVHFVDPIWLGAQMLPVVQWWLPGVPCVSSYHTNLATYATLFGLPWLERSMWALTRSLHERCEVTFCLSQSTRRMLRQKGFQRVEIWSRGVDTQVFGPHARDENLRESWGCTPKPAALARPLTPSVRAADEAALVRLAGKLGVSIVPRSSARAPPSPLELSPPPSYDSLGEVPDLLTLPPHTSDSKAVILYVGRISWEKNLRLLIEAFRLLPLNARGRAKLVFVGDGPARGDLTRQCKRLGLDASFMGHQKGKRLAAMYASASVFAFPSFTETFGQVVLEALASGLPVVGLHAEGTSDLVCHGKTGLLLDVNAHKSPAANESDEEKRTANGLNTPIPSIHDFAAAMTAGTPWFSECAQAYSSLLERLILDRQTRAVMGQRAVAYASNKTWWDAMNAPVTGYEAVILRASSSNLTDDELEALRTRQRRKAPLTGLFAKLLVLAYLLLFLSLWLR